MIATLRHRLGDESGFALATVMILLLVVMLMGAAAIAATLDSSDITIRSAKQRSAQQAAEAGVQSQLYQQSENEIGNSGSSYDLNGGLLSLGNFLDCIEPQFSLGLAVTGLTNVAANSSGVCPVNGTSSVNGGGFVPTSLGNGAYAESEFIPGASNPKSGASERDLAPKIVSLGWTGSSSPSASGNVFSRVEAILSPISPLPVVGANGTMTLSGVSALSIPITSVVNGDLQAGSAMNLPLVTLGVNTSWNNGLLAVFKCGCSQPSGIPVANFDGPTTVPNRQPISISSSKLDCPTVDSNGNSGCSAFASYYTQGSSSTCTSASPCSGDIVNVPSGKTMTIYGGDYVFCNFSAAGTVNADPTANDPVRIFIDSPSSPRCAGNNPSKSTNATFSHSEWSEGNFYAANGVNNSEGITTPSGVQIYVAGDQATPPFDDNTFVQLGTPPTASLLSLGLNPLTMGLIVYAPTSNVLMTTAACTGLLGLSVTCVGGVFEGNLIGNDVTATAATFTQPLDLGDDPLYNGLNAYHIEQEIQCSPVTSLQQNATTDTSGC